ncbi:asparagine synthase-related protein [Henriciella aquimarina]|uniref:asparagine synthase-related protein n=1 Tax=Henriciella aquimarina TaxID=545261 RepID=UPI00117AE5D8|nr:asparagine synthetase B family protein [Henriciella aquimarina]
MDAFLAITCHPEDAEAAMEARTLALMAGRSHPRAPRLERPGLILFDLSDRHGPNRLLALSAHDGSPEGAVFGSVFARSDKLVPAPPVHDVMPEEARRILRSRGGALLADYWGSYIAFLPDADGYAVLTSPTGAIPCFHTRRGAVRLVFSDLAACACLGWRDTSINYDFVGRLLLYDKIQTGETGLCGVHELNAGCRLDASLDAETGGLVWDPREVAGQALELPEPDAARLLRQTVRYVVQSWAADCGAILLNLSGGLDSAIVAACLGEMDRGDIEAVHFRLLSDDPPEAHYARDAARCAGLALHEIPLDPATALPAPEHHPLSVRPWRQFLALDHGDAIGGDLLAGQPALFSGQGGDHLFLETRSPLVFADYVSRHGPGPRLAAELLGAARLSGQSIWSTAASAMSALHGRNRESRFARDLAARSLPMHEAAGGPSGTLNLLPLWACERGGLPPAKFEQVASLVHMAHLRDTVRRDGLGRTCHPLISQPLVDLCLRLPAYCLSPRGVSRGLARHAMTGRIPDSVRLRRSKGNASKFFAARISAARQRIVSHLMEGELVRQGLLKAAEVEAFMRTDAFARMPSGRTMLVLYAIEAWLQRWKSYQA